MNNPIVFSATKPSAPGFFWYRTADSDGVLVNVSTDEKGILRAAAMLPNDFVFRPVIALDEMVGEWSEAIDMPAPDEGEQAAEQTPPADGADSSSEPAA